jgi:hypothetical protein
MSNLSQREISGGMTTLWAALAYGQSRRTALQRGFGGFGPGQNRSAQKKVKLGVDSGSKMHKMPLLSPGSWQAKKALLTSLKFSIMLQGSW